MEEVFEEIDSIIGEEKTEYQVISLGMYPSIPLYNGYQCADGYSNNYDLAYKHQFRKIIRGELDKNEEVKKYFDDWGNRCYLPTATYGFHGMLGKDSHVTFSDLSFDFEEMKSMHIKYLFSTGEILDADKYGIELVNESPFSSEKSFYNIWVYEIF